VIIKTIIHQVEIVIILIFETDEFKQSFDHVTETSNCYIIEYRCILYIHVTDSDTITRPETF
jgi:hypothetical protein